MKSLIFFILYFYSNHALADRRFECDFNNGDISKMTIVSQSPDKFPHSYTYLALTKRGDDKSSVHKLEVLDSNDKSAVFRFLIGTVVGSLPAVRYGILAWAPGSGTLYVNIISHGTSALPPNTFRLPSWGYAGLDVCQPVLIDHQK